MVGQNRAALISQIGAWSTPKITEGKSIDFAGAVDAWNKGRQLKEQREKEQLNKERRDAYIEAINGGNQEEIDKAFANYDPEAYARVMTSRQDADTQFARQKELANINFNNQLALANLKNKQAMALKQMEYQGLGGIEGFTPTGNPAYDKAVVAQLAKDNVEKAKALRQVAEMQPAVEEAMARADKAVDDGTGIGATSARGLVGDGFWGQLLSSKKADQNRTDIETANNQMNSFLRSKLASTGLTGGELNSALEAEAYRYTIKPNDSKAQIAQKLKNFRNDYLRQGNQSAPATATQASDPLGLR